MYIHQKANLETIMNDVRRQIEAVLSGSKNGCDVTVRKHVNRRSNDQNEWLWAVYKRIVEFWTETGFIPDQLPVKFINSDFLHEYFKMRFDIRSTAKLSTTEFGDYIRNIQNLMVEQSYGEYEPIVPPEKDYLEKTGLIKAA